MVVGVSAPSSSSAPCGMLTAGEVFSHAVPPTVGSLGSKAARWTLRDGRLRVMLVNVGAAASASVVTKTWVPTATTTLLLCDGATLMRPALGKLPMLLQLFPPSWLCHKFWLPLT